MGRSKELIEKYGLRDQCSVRGVVGQKMDEKCIQKFIQADPSGNCKYLDWMFFQAGGGNERFQKSVMQWEKGDYGEQPVSATLRSLYIKDCVNGYTGDHGEHIPPVSPEVAADQWDAEACAIYRNQHIYGDEDYVLTGFGFYRSWPGNNNLYGHIADAVRRFHRYRQKLKSTGKSTDLNTRNYPDLKDLQSALADITLLEIKDKLDHDIVFEDENLVVICPYTVGSSMKFGHQKWCTANESMFKAAISGEGPNRWKEYAKDSALYYCQFKRFLGKSVPGLYQDTVSQIAIQAPHKSGTESWRFFDIEDASHAKPDANLLVASLIGSDAVKSWEAALEDIADHLKLFDKSRVNLDFVIKK